ncbi:MAG TPA: hypothetical protein DCZ72_00680 [Armatimonadetes bacterium]|nr:hypothetical protein [Armatimonadota bacterium]
MVLRARRYNVPMRWARAIWLGVLTALGLAACADLDAPPPKIVKAPPEEAEEETGVFELGGRNTVQYSLADGRFLFDMEGTLRAVVGARGGTGDLLDALATSHLPEYQATITAGRLRYQVGRPTLLLDHRFEARAPVQRATLRGERGEFHTPSLEFDLPGRARLTYAGTVMTLHQVRAKLDLRTVTGRQVVARHEAADRSWLGEAQTVTIDEGRATFEHVEGQFRGAREPVDFRAPRGVWSFAEQTLSLPDNPTIVFDGTTIAAQQAVYHHRTGHLTTTGETTLSRPDLRAHGTGAKVDLHTRLARLNSVTATLGGDRFTAQSATIAESGEVVLEGVRGTLADGTLLRATRARYADGQLVATGVAAEQAGRTLYADTARHRPGTGWVAEGNVRLVGDGMEARGGRLTADAELSAATLSPVEASGAEAGGRWHLTATAGTLRNGQRLILREPRGTFSGPGRRATVRAREATWLAAENRIDFEGNFVARSPADGLELTAERASYHVADQRFTASGQVNGTVRGVVVRGRNWVYRLGASDDQLLSIGASEPTRSAPARQGPPPVAGTQPDEGSPAPDEE